MGTPQINHSFLLELIKQASESFLHRNALLEAVCLGKISKEAWRVFAIQRYLAALPFERALLVGAKTSEKKYPRIAEALRKNLDDEIGRDAKGCLHPELAHTLWRQDFYQALGISKEELSKAVPLPGTHMYTDTLQKLILDADPLALGGAILILEATIPIEFKKMKQGRDITFYQEFTDRPQDDEGRVLEKKKARLYLDDHILHDASSHFPDLLKALELSITRNEEHARIRSGANVITQAKKLFYQNLISQLVHD